MNPNDSGLRWEHAGVGDVTDRDHDLGPIALDDQMPRIIDGHRNCIEGVGRALDPNLSTNRR